MEARSGLEPLYEVLQVTSHSLVINNLIRQWAIIGQDFS